MDGSFQPTSESTPPVDFTDDPLLVENESLRERITFLENSLDGLEREVTDLRNVLFTNEAVHNDLLKSFTTLKKSSSKECQGLEGKLEQQKQQIQQLQAQNKQVLQPRVFKTYHALSDSQKTKEHRRIREYVTSDLEPHLKKRKLGIRQITLEHSDGVEEDVRINAHPANTFANLTEAEKKIVSRVSDYKCLNRQSDASYAGINSVTHVLPPLSHIKSHNALIMLPEIEVAAGKSGGFCKVLQEVETQLNHLTKVVELRPTDEVHIKAGIDSTKLVNKNSVCVYTIASIAKKGSQIGAVGAVQGGDAWEDMQLSAVPFLNQLEALAKDPNVATAAGIFKVKIVWGGDMCNLLELFGLSKACSKYPCLYCLLSKTQFAAIPYRSDIYTMCNESHLVRTRANILDESRKSVRRYSVKNSPLSPLPLDPSQPLLTIVVICMLHLVMRIVGKKKKKLSCPSVHPFFLMSGI